MLSYDMNIIERGIRGMFAREFITRQRKAKYTRFCTVVDSDKKTERFNAISTLPQMAEFTDERVVSGFSDYTYDLTNKVYGTSIKIPRTLFEFDQTGQLRTLVQSMGARVANFPDKLVMTTVGNNGTCYDGGNHFSTTHNLGAGTSGIQANNSNIVSGNVTNTLLANMNTKSERDELIAAFQADLITAKARFFDFVDDRGEPWHEDCEPESLIALVHPSMEFYVRTALEASIISDTGNLTARSIGAIITTNYPMPFYGSDGATVYKGTWFLMKIDGPIQPFLFQRFAPKTTFPDAIPEADQSVLQALSAVEVQVIMRTGQNIDSHTFFDDEFLVGARGIYSSGYGMWQNIVQVRAGDYS